MFVTVVLYQIKMQNNVMPRLVTTFFIIHKENTKEIIV